ncbi:hypothetical protein [Actinomadura sp. 6N118]|uniref:hypothetical protein n=1 Tax=Actinomadura sp. 6N118 TaxID=3375151 RepID=UPI00378912FB
MDRTAWESLPPDLREAVEQRLGSVVKAEPVREGRRSAFAAALHTTTGRVFLKGSPDTDAKAMAQLDRESALAPFIAGVVAPSVLLDEHTAGWRVLAFDHITGYRASYSPGSPDVPRAVETLASLDEIDVPAEVPLMRFEVRWSSFTPATRRLGELAGAALLHTDLNPGNILVGAGTATLVDWGMASRGAAFVNPCDLVINLIAGGHDPREAESAVADLDAWQTAAPDTIDYYARTVAIAWLEAFWNIRHPWANAVVRAAQRWALHRRDH